MNSSIVSINENQQEKLNNKTWNDHHHHHHYCFISIQKCMHENKLEKMSDNQNNEKNNNNENSSSTSNETKKELLERTSKDSILILGSSSKWRQSLLKGFGVGDFKVLTAGNLRKLKTME